MFMKEKILTVLISLVTLISTFAVAISSFSFSTKIYFFGAVVFSFLVIEIGLSFYRPGEPEKVQDLKPIEINNNLFSPEVEEKLLVLEEANNFFGASLKSADMFRLVTSRVSQMVDFDSGVLFLLNNQNILLAKFATGLNSRLLKRISLNCNEGLAGRAFVNKKVELDLNLLLDKEFLFEGSLKNLGSGIAIPLIFAGEVFAVLNLYRESPKKFDENIKVLLEAVGERIAPLIKSSFTFEQSLSNALVDSLTKLPNERAFYLVLENQIAEAQRFQSERDLTILAIDIKGFSEINSRFGHSTGDKLLAFASQLIKEQLREMDFLARSQNDEFLIILPTASGDTARKIINRINQVFIKKPFEFGDGQRQNIELNFGTATFYEDGEQSNQLFRAAIANKKKEKAIGNGSVIKFPREFVN
jgi:diguanylate cyclase (GGDEF)-like protein